MTGARRRLVSVSLLGAITLCGWPAPAAAQTADGAVGIFGGYAWSQPALDAVHLSLGDGLHAWVAGVRAPIHGPVTVVGEVEGAYGATFAPGLVVRPTGTERRSLYAVEVGPHYRPTRWRVAPYGEARVGVVHAQARSMGVDFLQAVTIPRSTLRARPASTCD